MKLLPLLLLICLYADVSGQQLSRTNKQVSVYIGAHTRVTPIYLEPVWEGFQIGYPDKSEQPDYHLSGPGLLFCEKKILGRKLVLSLQQVIRHDFLYQRMPMDLVLPPDFSYSIKRKWIIDLAAELNLRFPRRKSVFLISLGAGLNGLNTGYRETRRYYQSPSSYTEKETQKNFLGDPSEHLSISPGMAADASIQTGKRTMMEYMLKPIVKTLDKSLRER